MIAFVSRAVGPEHQAQPLEVVPRELTEGKDPAWPDDGGPCATMSLVVATSTAVTVQATWLLLCDSHVEFITLFDKTQPLPPGREQSTEQPAG